MLSQTYLKLTLWVPLTLPYVIAFNLYVEEPTIYSGPKDSYFGYSVDFYLPDQRIASILVGAPKANTSQRRVVEGGAVYYCPWPATNARCHQIPFDTRGNRMLKLNDTKEPVEFKSNQWFGATVKAYKAQVVACAPLYQWRTLTYVQEKDPVGTCYVATQNFSSYFEYSPCRNAENGPGGQGYCNSGFSLDFTKNGDIVLGAPGSYYWQGQVISAGVADIITGYSMLQVMRNVTGEKQTGMAQPIYDDNYLGYSVAVGEFTGDSEQEFVAGVPRGAQNFGYVAVIDSSGMKFIQNFTGEQMASYFGYTVAVEDINGDGLDDILIGAPLFMDREFESNPKEVGQIYLFLQKDVLKFASAQILKGSKLFGRFGSAIASLGDLDQDGYNDVAIGAPFAGEDKAGRVFIYNGYSEGLKVPASQVLSGSWASEHSPLVGFGFSLRGNSDIDDNEYPDLIVGAFGAGKAAVYRARPVVTVEAQLLLDPVMVNPDQKHCQIQETNMAVSCFSVKVCTSVTGQGIPDTVVLNAELHLDVLKQKGATKRTLFLDLHEPHRAFTLLTGKRKLHVCRNFTVYLRDETEFRDKLTPVNISLNYSLSDSAPLNDLALRPVLNYYGETFKQNQTYIQVDCGTDNICIPDLKLSATVDKQQLIIGEDNQLTLIVTALNEKEGAYEAELHVTIPPEVDYIGTERNNEGFHKMSCEYKMENVTRMVVCDLGNPMAAGTNLSLGLRFAVQRLEEADPSITFDLQIKSSNKDNSTSNLVTVPVYLNVVAEVNIRGESHPAQIALPLYKWEPKANPKKEEDIGPLIQHIYELHNQGPSTISDTILEVDWPNKNQDEFLLYIIHMQTYGPMKCQTSPAINPLQIEALPDTPELIGFLRNSTALHAIRKRSTPAGDLQKTHPAKILDCSNVNCLKISCKVGLLEQGQSAVLKLRSRLWAQTFLKRKNSHYSLSAVVSYEVKKMPYKIKLDELPRASTVIKTLVIWATPNVSFSIPLWVIILAILLGLLVLAILTLVMWKCGFFDRERPPEDDLLDKGQLTSDKEC
ncbi:integrin alpha-8 [Protopterus annectens]|uniref:integrin alpha-8 n=1 Tax=Protopterus annectens TaxID=7888 RepID=UPI001CFBDC2E|nr:integrin alpha-8 [Protopterus annectens]